MEIDTKSYTDSIDGLANCTQNLFKEMKFCMDLYKLNENTAASLMKKYNTFQLIAKNMEGYRVEIKKLVEDYNNCDKTNELLVQSYITNIEDLSDYYIRSEIKLQQKLKGWQSLYCASILENNKTKEM